MADERNEKSLATLFSDLTRDTVELIRQEIALARADISQKVGTAQGALASIAIGAAVVLAGLFLLLQAAVEGLSMVLPPEYSAWLSPLIVGAVVALVGWAMLNAGKAKLNPEHLAPRRTMDSLRRDRAVVQEKMQ